MASEASIVSGSRRLLVRWADGGQSEYPAVWLRDNCHCSKCYTAGSIHVRTLLMEHLDVDCTLTKAELSTDAQSISVSWSDGCSCSFPVDWLRQRAFEPGPQRQRAALHRPGTVTWGAEMAQSLPRLPYDLVMSEDAAMLEALLNLERYGLVLLEGAPKRPGAVRAFCEKVAFMRTSHFGDEFTVRVKVDPNSIAYTGNNIEIHTDSCYYDYMPGIQLLHFIVQYEGKGGETQLADGAKVCEDLRREDPQAFHTLATVPVDFKNVTKSDNGQAHFKLLKAPVITTDSEGALQCLRFTTSQRDSYFSVPLDQVEPWYKAKKKLLNMLYDEKYIIKRKMNEGDMIVFDNVRLVHGREPLYESDKVGERHLEGGYIDWDEARSRRRVLQEKLAGNPSGYGF
ncbi:gamma-butyrobetaine dioxygenase-like [Amphibalanus amphitrite]|uniref:gamma-butyrobetaine dioxygenase-like n=1 Tax=Amphibalanus amphitrite TaxID=1232801 RepID=UPI001C8FD3B8|nr:gamma-butyrobetaine dioxygenase-like [Amphibalanus amphitrite]